MEFQPVPRVLRMAQKVGWVKTVGKDRAGQVSVDEVRVSHGLLATGAQPARPDAAAEEVTVFAAADGREGALPTGGALVNYRALLGRSLRRGRARVAGPVGGLPARPAAE